MGIITLTTDFGYKDHFTGAVKGALLSEYPLANIVDISHSVSPFNIAEAAYIIKNAYKNFPEGTIHIIGIDAELTSENKHIVVQLKEHYFICANNGIMSMICSELAPDKIVEINIHNKIENSFNVLNVFVKVAGHIARGGTLEVIGRLITDIKQITNINPRINESKKQIIGNVIYIDNYGNVVTNIKKSVFKKLQAGKNYEVTFKNQKFKKIYNQYSEIINFNLPPEKRYHEGAGLLLFNSADYLEIAIYKSNQQNVGGAESLMGLKFRDTVTVNFFEN